MRSSTRRRLASGSGSTSRSMGFLLRGSRGRRIQGRRAAPAAPDAAGSSWRRRGLAPVATRATSRQRCYAKPRCVSFRSRSSRPPCSAAVAHRRRAAMATAAAERPPLRRPSRFWRRPLATHAIAPSACARSTARSTTWTSRSMPVVRRRVAARRTCSRRIAPGASRARAAAGTPAAVTVPFPATAAPRSPTRRSRPARPADAEGGRHLAVVQRIDRARGLLAAVAAGAILAAAPRR
jgi:hypothetical protein